MHADNAEIAEVLSTQIIKDIQVSHANNYFIAKSAASRGRSCAGPQKMFDMFLKEVGTLF